MRINRARMLTWLSQVDELQPLPFLPTQGLLYKVHYDFPKPWADQIHGVFLTTIGGVATVPGQIFMYKFGWVDAEDLNRGYLTPENENFKTVWNYNTPGGWLF